MSEKRIRPRQVLILIIVFIVILLFVHRNGRCEAPSEYLRTVYTQHRDEKLPKIYAITPTYTRPTQKAELTRLSHVFMLVPNLHWIIVEDANATTALVTNLLKRAGLADRSTQMNVKTPQEFKLQNKDPHWSKPRGVEQRNLALTWLRAHVDPERHSLVYFMDDDNVYSIELFGEIGKIERGRVGVWPVGLVGGLMVEKPKLTADGKEVQSFNSAWHPERPFPIDMAGFAISTDLFFRYPEASFNYNVPRGWQESEVLRHITTLKQLQPLANQCKDVLVWHTRTEAASLKEEDKLRKQGQRSDDGMEV